LTNQIPTEDLLAMAKSMTKEHYTRGDVLYRKGDPCDVIYLVIVGEILLDTEDIASFKGEPTPFYGSQASHCYILSGSSLVGEEGLLGNKRVYGSSAAIVSEVASVFRVDGYGKRFFSERLASERYAALAYRDVRCWGPTFGGERMLVESYFNTLRKEITDRYPSRGLFSERAEIDDSARTSYFHPELFKNSDGEVLATQQTVHLKTKEEIEAEKEAAVVAERVEKRKRDEQRARAARGGRSAPGLPLDDDSAGVKWSTLPRLMLHHALQIRNTVLHGREVHNQSRRLAKESLLREEYQLLRKDVKAGLTDKGEHIVDNHLSKAIQSHLERMNLIPRETQEEEEEEEHQGIVISLFNQLGTPSGGDLLDEELTATGTVGGNGDGEAVYSDTDSDEEARGEDHMRPRSVTSTSIPARGSPRSPGSVISRSASVTSGYSATDSSTNASSYVSFVPVKARNRVGDNALMLTKTTTKVEMYVKLVMTTSDKEKEKTQPLEDPKAKLLLLNLPTAQPQGSPSALGEGKPGSPGSPGTADGTAFTTRSRIRQTMRAPVAKAVAAPKNDFTRVAAPKTRRIRPSLWRMAKALAKQNTDTAIDLDKNLTIKRLRLRAGYRGKEGAQNRLYPQSYVSSFDLDNKEGMREMLTNTEHDYIKKRREYVAKYNWNTRFMKLSDQATGGDNASTVQEDSVTLSEQDKSESDDKEHHHRHRHHHHDHHGVGEGSDREGDDLGQASDESLSVYSESTISKSDIVASPKGPRASQVKSEKDKGMSVLERFLETQATEADEAAFLNGKKKESRLSRFRLFQEEPGDLLIRSQRDEVLLEAGHSDASVAGMTEEESRKACLEQIHGSGDMASWQLYSIGSTVEGNEGAKVTLPTLGSRALKLAGSGNQRKGRYGSRLVYLPGKHDGVFKGAPTYLDVTRGNGK